MRRYLLRGDIKKQNEFIDKLVREYSVPKHLVIRYAAPFSIKNAHVLKSLLSLSLSEKEMRCVVIPSDMSIEAQNALLKLIEELDDKTILVISGTPSEELLSTILSRVQEVRFGEEILLDPEISRQLKALDQGKSERMELSIALSENKGDVALEVLLCLREKLLKNYTDMGVVVLIDKIFQNLEPYCKNNLHKRLFWDTILLSSTK